MHITKAYKKEGEKMNAYGRVGISIFKISLRLKEGKIDAF